MPPDIWFYNLNIRINNMPRVAISLGNFNIYWYGILVMLGVLAGYAVAAAEAKRTNQDKNIYYDFVFLVVPMAILGGRLFFFIFSDIPISQFFNLRTGGLAIFGVITASLITAYFWCKRKNLNFLTFMDTAILGLIIGHVIGRFGNFLNREAFGSFTENIFALRLRVDQLLYFPESLRDTIITYNNIEYVQVHPVFFYEAFLNLALFIFLMFYKKRKAFEGEILFIYFAWYGIVRSLLEPLRIDALMQGGIRVSMVSSIIMAITGIALIIYFRFFSKKKKV
ncbi:MAG: prolipoprotein diacylglyceryl transferase [Defluviitaleaceae bacterium]|nr:prolipoprotein diacylglyceryl transferase [Defluviitaleaceae bacterium]